MQTESTISLITDPKTYAKILYLLLSLPVGILYFTIAVTGFTLSIGLTPIFVGFPLAIGMLQLSKGVLRWESTLAGQLLHQPVPEWGQREPSPPGFWSKLSYYATDFRSYKGLLFMILKLPLGIISFTVCITAIATSAAFLAAPLVQIILINEIGIDIYESSLLNLLPFGLSYTQQSLIYVAIGLFCIWLFIRILHFIAQISAGFALFMAEEK
ncbi:sensor domain-containing protein [Paenibacillus turpanensis]|uniref:sensor domain-containing protein n=1 Tax=Paenibacillus turpanensis TaxID=2689078 RepID=UPI0014080EB5|nr:sensor domain-containing protein [Paenibacillus turpanensis]